MSDIGSRGYVVADALVSTSWVAQHLDDPDVRIVESNEDPLLYASGHIPGAVEVDWTRDLNDPLCRDYLQRDRFEALASRIGITRDTTIVFYGDKSNWWATYALWVFHLFGHTNCRIMDGGRLKWQKEGRPLTKEVPSYPATEYRSPERDDKEFRAFRDQVLQHLHSQGKMIDVRSPEEYNGTRLHMEAYPNEGALRGGHIPGAKNVPWAKAVDPETGEFLPADKLRSLYEEMSGLNPQDDVIVYCRIGERSSHTWFALHYLLGYPSVRNYDGSWTEWGNLVGAPIER
ncbi:sulfurtransferase [Fimbriimonas ginsengisoli]|uniref:Sulfurtransferase n=1 Tax=Fimbriimonas ginsengisoli Gsoil 348 TaxID=661478 RepID=A0A068NR20_FIMGI|nr:sulfurtransferase [Fimbriimonas ginsengisoli]AIE85886.1 rhodanese domain-containing protein [Fimbriimonas ginsengisoli Gsoil 348]